MKTGTLATRLMLAAILLTVLIYFGINLAAYFSDPFTTTVAYEFTSERSVTVSGYVVRQEEVLPGGQGDLVRYTRGEGERISAGGAAALVYSSAQALADANTLRELQEQLQQLLSARSLTAGRQTDLRLEEEIAASLISFRAAAAAGDLSAAGESGGTLRSAVLRRSYAYGGTGDLESAIASLQTRIDTLSASADAGATAITAPRSGLFSSLVDGYETVLTPESLADLTPSAYRQLTPVAGAAGAGKLVYGSQWHFAALMEAEDTGRIQTGDRILLRLQRGLDRDLEMTVSSISEEENGQQVVVFTSDAYLNLTTLLRRQNAQVIFQRYEGIRVPRSAVRMVDKPVTDEEGKAVLREDGTPVTEKVTAVYSKWGTTSRQKDVTVLWQEEDYILVEPAAWATSERRLRAGDEVITAAAELYDGKVIN